jgi:hypothetical protein
VFLIVILLSSILLTNVSMEALMISFLIHVIIGVCVAFVID